MELILFMLEMLFLFLQVATWPAPRSLVTLLMFLQLGRVVTPHPPSQGWYLVSPTCIHACQSIVNSIYTNFTYTDIAILSSHHTRLSFFRFFWGIFLKKGVTMNITHRLIFIHVPPSFFLSHPLLLVLL